MLGPRPLLAIAAALVVLCSLIAFQLPDHSVREPPHGHTGTWQALCVVAWRSWRSSAGPSKRA